MELARIANKGTSSIKKYTPGKSIQEAQAEFGITDPVKLASNENALGSSTRVAGRLRELAARVHHYPDSKNREIRALLAGRLRVDTVEITTGNGADAVIYNLGMAVIDQGDEVIMPRVTFPIYDIVTRVMRGIPVYSGMKGLRIDLEDIAGKLTGRTKVVFLCNPNNPTGDALPPAALEEFLDSVPDSVLLVLDEAYIDFTEPESRFEAIGRFKAGMSNLFILRSFSKSYGLAGLRFGYGIGDRELVSLIDMIKPPFGVSVLAEQAAVAALGDQDFVARTVSDCLREREYFYREIQGLGLEHVRSHTNFLLIDTGQDAQAVAEGLLRRGVIVRPAGGYGLPTAIRVTVGRHAENERFFEALRAVLGQG